MFFNTTNHWKATVPGERLTYTAHSSMVDAMVFQLNSETGHEHMVAFASPVVMPAAKTMQPLFWEGSVML